MAADNCENNEVFKAVRVEKFGDPSVLELKDIKEWALEKDEVLVKLHAVGVNPVDTYIRSGAYSRLPRLPYTPGGDGAGVVEKVGEGVEKVKVGDRVWLSGSVAGTYAQKTKAKESNCHILPEIVSYAQGAAINVPYATAYRALFVRGKGKEKKEGEKLKVLIHGGSGGVGIAAIQLSVDAGFEVFATAGSEEGIELMKKQGAHHTYNHRENNYNKQIQTDSKDGVDMIVEMLANVNLDTDINLLRRGGVVLVVGNRGTVEINPRGLMGREADIRGVALSLSSPEERKEIDDAIQDGLQRGALKPVIGEERKLADVSQAHVDILTTRRLGKMVLVPWE
uniref:Enoyl reductase (ER) domain-containing protein n=1 Tax=Paramoeba aestuarina TaxID=180227 RepID=A0A7S4PBH3_9EUKA|mmetsp:Transcript_39211/g.62051  ORF Transcript_39211/g.62051 Transcript_39211/m.62051 type:complete len:338 (+) Transcript_39211:115-1128(+)|eukprot:CAMPEP_0201507130 /NCGR_PEP_ID=MMETSP0161_2-20130828/893_1 /ASSEMBLY_ACC=CAM_ASM_000251 /TAXON_ID=180227 /ORGANISM="Neoparamoeba aestuarina, Strain SoJaBio B1-5/56/2" /LENGTH=337 /DNA_ID=CAMNT_0047901413 /DNA_START=111 /DNA_END=1124 /DNA_ORIENTATION=-